MGTLVRHWLRRDGPVGGAVLWQPRSILYGIGRAGHQLPSGIVANSPGKPDWAEAQRPVEQLLPELLPVPRGSLVDVSDHRVARNSLSVHPTVRAGTARVLLPACHAVRFDHPDQFARALLLHLRGRVRPN